VTRSPNQPEPRAPAPRTASTGCRGEQLAAEHLRHSGYRIVARNLRTAHGEIDLLVRRGRRWAAVEVKTSHHHPAPERCLHAEQLDRLARSLLALAPGLRPRPHSLQVDVIAVRLPGGGEDAGKPAELLHLPALRRVAGSADGAGGWRCAVARWLPWPKPPCERRHPSLPSSSMPTLAEQIIPRRKLLLMLCETAIFTAVLLVGTSVPPLTSRSFELLRPSMDLLQGLLSCFTVAVICQAALSYNDLYDWKTAQNRAELGNRLVHSFGYALVMMAFLVLVLPSLFFFPGIADISAETWKLILLLGVAFGALFVFRHAFHWFFYKWRFGERIVVLGSSEEAQRLCRLVLDHPMAGFELLGLIEEPGQPPLPHAPGDPPVLGRLSDLRQLCRDEAISRVVVALRERRGMVPVDTLLQCRMDGVLIEEREAMYERLTGKLAVESMRPSYLIYGRGFAKDPLTLVTKRVLDITVSLVGLLLTLPISLTAALLVKLTSKGPVFFRQVRVGEDGKEFELIKFRTMRTDAEKDTGPVWAQQNDSRVTVVGRFFRRTRIDEIPQFLNILRGQMSFVGPRPERPHFVAQLAEQIPFYPLRHTVKPGLTGWAQVSHPYGASIDDAREKLRYDLYYIKNLNLLFDLNIMLRTIGVILRGTGAR
jgi:sugar transferase (PEP-CTERM system associated)